MNHKEYMSANQENPLVPEEHDEGRSAMRAHDNCCVIICVKPSQAYIRVKDTRRQEDTYKLDQKSQKEQLVTTPSCTGLVIRDELPDCP
jgi:hypothetical protein